MSGPGELNNQEMETGVHFLLGRRLPEFFSDKLLNTGGETQQFISPHPRLNVLAGAFIGREDEIPAPVVEYLAH